MEWLLTISALSLLILLLIAHLRPLLQQLNIISRLMLCALLVLSLAGIFVYWLIPETNVWRDAIIYAQNYSNSLLFIGLTVWAAHFSKKFGDLRSLLNEKDVVINQQRAVLESVVHAVPVAIAWRDLSGIFLGCNQAYAELLQLPISEIIGKNILLLPKSNSKLKENLSIHLEKDKEAALIGFVQYEIEDAGSVRIHYKSAYHTPVEGVVSVVLDVTEQMRNRKLIQSKDAVFRTFLDLTDDIVIVFNASLLVCAVTPSIAEISTLAPLSIEKKSIGELAHACGFFKKMQPIIKRTLQTKEKQREKINCCPPFCRTDVWLDIQTSPVFVSKNVKYVFMSARDVSELVYALKEKDRINHLLVQSQALSMEVGKKRLENDELRSREYPAE